VWLGGGVKGHNSGIEERVKRGGGTCNQKEPLAQSQTVLRPDLQKRNHCPKKGIWGTGSREGGGKKGRN